MPTHFLFTLTLALISLDAFSVERRTEGIIEIKFSHLFGYQFLTCIAQYYVVKGSLLGVGSREGPPASPPPVRRLAATLLASLPVSSSSTTSPITAALDTTSPDPSMTGSSDGTSSGIVLPAVGATAGILLIMVILFLILYQRARSAKRMKILDTYAPQVPAAVISQVCGKVLEKSKVVASPPPCAKCSPLCYILPPKRRPTKCST